MSIRLMPKEKPSCGAISKLVVFTAQTESKKIRRVAIPSEWISMIGENDDYTCDVYINADLAVNVLEPLEVCVSLFYESMAELCDEEEPTTGQG